MQVSQVVNVICVGTCVSAWRPSAIFSRLANEVKTAIFKMVELLAGKLVVSMLS